MNITDTRSPQNAVYQSIESNEKVLEDAQKERLVPTLRNRAAKAKDVAAEESLVGALCIWIVNHQIGIAINLLLLNVLTHICFSRARWFTSKFWSLSYYNPETRRYAIGWDDGLIVVNWLVIFTGLRIFVMEYIGGPLAQHAGITSKKGKVRFAEQAWMLTYYGIFWSLGMYIMYNSDYWLNMKNLWTHWPDREIGGLLKWYYLVQFACWLQQIVTVNIEERRKDHVQMFTHHLITCALMTTSYAYHHTRVGNLILVTMDSVDIILPSAKMLKYLKFTTACDVAFGLFVVTWAISRHVIYLLICWSIYSDLPNTISYGCYYGPSSNSIGPFPPPDNFWHLLVPFQQPNGLVCQSKTTTNMFLGMLLFLQGIMLLWFTMIVRVVTKVLSGEAPDDIRSDDEDAEEEEDVEDVEQNYQSYIEVPPQEKEVDADDIDFSGRKSSPARKSRRNPGVASGVSLPSDTKELLGRIGCDKGS